MRAFQRGAVGRVVRRFRLKIAINDETISRGCAPDPLTPGQVRGVPEGLRRGVAVSLSWSWSHQPQGRAYAAAPARRYTFDRTPYGWMEREVGSGGVVDPGAACGHLGAYWTPPIWVTQPHNAGSTDTHRTAPSQCPTPGSSPPRWAEWHLDRSRSSKKRVEASPAR
eukprot:scaffold115020_cov33-Phaeocystis_antarctica.AAC.1